MAERIHNLLRDYTKTEKRALTHVVTEFDEAAKGFDERAFFAFRQGLARETEKGIQTNSYGNLHRAFNNPEARAFLTLKSFMYGSITKQLIKNFRDAGTYAKQGLKDLAKGNLSGTDGFTDSMISLSEPVANMMLQYAFGVMGYIAIQEIGLIGVSREQAEKKRAEYMDISNLNQAGVARASSLGLIPTLWNTPMQAINPEWTFGMNGYSSSGLAKTATSIPAFDMAYRWMKGAGQAGQWMLDDDPLTQEGLTRAQKLLTNQQLVTIATNVIGAQLFELEPE
jgi:hypothetical protein